MKEIQSRVFENCTALDNVTVPTTLDKIDSDCFKGCTGLRNFSFAGEGPTSIGQTAFQGCTNLVAPTFPLSVKEIYSNAFDGCKNLGTLTFNGGMTINNNAFANCGITEIVWPTEALKLNLYVFHHSTKLTELTIPGWLTTIPNQTFAYAHDLKKLTISEGVETIEQSAFYGDSVLTALSLPSSLKNIRQNAFNNCVRLEDFVFPENMTIIERDAFSSCKALKHLVLPKNVSLQPTVFNSTALLSITFPDEPMGELMRQCFGCQAEITAIEFPGWMEIIPNSLCYNWPKLKDVTFKEGVKEIGNQAFNGPNSIVSIKMPASMRIIGTSAFISSTNLQTVEFNDGLTLIDSQAFQSSSLPSVTIPPSVEKIGKYAFYQCGSLIDVIFQDTADEDGLENARGLRTIGEYAFSEDRKLVNVTLPRTIETIDNRAFSTCWNLADLNWPESLKKIGDYAFFQCRYLTFAKFNAGARIGDHAFRECDRITNIIFPDSPCEFGPYVFEYNKLIKTFSFPEWMTKVPDGFCSYWDSLTSIDLHNGITTIGKGAFSYCKQLRNVEFPDFLEEIQSDAFNTCSYAFSHPDEEGKTVTDYFGEVVLPDDIKVRDNAFANSTVTKIAFKGCAEFGKDCFLNLKQIKEFGFPSCLDTIPSGFCNGWEKLERVVLPVECKVIKEKAFMGTSALTSMTYTGYDAAAEGASQWVFPPQLEEIQDMAFQKSAIREINWPDYPLKLGTSIFRECEGLTSVTIPRWMDALPDYTFYHDTAFKSHISEVKWEERGADNPDHCSIGTYAFYTNASLEAIDFPEIDITLGDHSFANCTKLNTIGWNRKGVTLGTFAFSGCSGMTELNLPDYITYIPDNCFSYTTGLSKVDLGRNLQTIGKSAFLASWVNELVWPDNLQEIQSDAFNTTKLIELVIPATVKTVGTQAFKQCNELQTVFFNDGCTSLSSYVFQNCTKLEKLRLPSTLPFIYGGYLCYGDVKLSELILPEGLLTIGSYDYENCTGLKQVVFPSTLKLVNSYAFASSGLEEVEDLAQNHEFYLGAFQNCSNLRRYHATGQITTISMQCFQNCGKLEEFIYDSDKPIGNISDNAFENCTVLHTFPHLGHGWLGNYAFRNCQSLKQLYMPSRFSSFYTAISGYPYEYLNGAKSLESIVFPSTGKRFKLTDGQIADAPLRALSFSYARNIVRPYADQTADSILVYTPDINVNIPNRGTAKLMVPRGERWKYMEAGYGQLFDIIEIKDPQINIEGHIYSKFNTDEWQNHYTAYLRWEVPYSDLNPDDETTVTIFRNNKEIGDIVFGKPEVVASVEGVKCDHDIIKVKVTLNGKPGGFYGDFNYPVLDDDGNLKYYQRVYMSESDYMYFDAYTHRRLVNIDKYGYTSWFIMKDEFVSPNLKTPGVAVPDRYTYTARMNGYKYYTLENNDGLVAGEDGELYHKVWHDPDSIRSTAYVMRTAQATPSISFPGLYTTAQILEDTNHSLEPTVVHDRRTDRRYFIKMSLDSALMAQKGRDINSTIDNDLVKGISIYRINDNETRTHLADVAFPNRKGEYLFEIPMSDYPGPGKRYQVDTYSYSDMLGTFGSAILSIPDAPTIAAPVSTLQLPSAGHNHDGVKWNGSITIRPTVEDTGYGYGKTPFTADSYRIGIWRTLDTNSVSPSGFYHLPAAEESDVLLHHVDGITTDGAGSPCDQCDVAAGLIHSDSAISYQDLYDLTDAPSHTVEYRTRMYVKVPDKSLGNETMWMIAEDTNSTGAQTVSGVDNVLQDDSIDPAAIRYFDLQGRPLAAPIPGNPCIRVTPNSSTVVTVN